MLLYPGAASTCMSLLQPQTERAGHARGKPSKDFSKGQVLALDWREFELNLISFTISDILLYSVTAD